MIENNQFLIDAVFVDNETPAWKRLDMVIRQWAVLTGHEKDQEQYEKNKRNDLDN